MNPEQNTADVSRNSNSSSKLESWASGILIALVFLLPIIFIPITYLQQGAIKGYLIIFCVLVSSILYMISRIKAKSFEWVANPLSYIGVILALILAASSVWSGEFMKSFFGQGFEYLAAAFIIILIISARLSTIISSRNSSRALSIYAAVMGSFALLAIFQIIKLINPSALSFGLFYGAASTPIGSWYDLGIFSGVVFILSSLAFLYFPMNRIVKLVIGILCAISIFFLVIVGLPSIWFGIALVFLALIFQRYINEKRGGSFGKRLPIFAIIVFVVAVFMSWNGNVIATPLANSLKVGYSELGLPWQMTLDVGTGILKSSPILGSGPNTFNNEFLLYKPLVINQTQFWSAGFSNGSGLVPTIALSLGLSGIILFCLLYIYFIRDGVRTLRKVGQLDTLENQVNGRLAQYISYSSFFAGAFLLYMDLVYVPTYVNFFLTFVFIGVFIGSMINSGGVRLASIPFNVKGKTALLARSCGMIVLLVVLVGFVWYGMKAIALGYFTSGAAAVSTSTPSLVDLANAQKDFQKALALDRIDVYDQALSEINLAGVNSIASQISAAGSSTKPTQDQIQQITSLINSATSFAAAAVKYDPSNYSNYMLSARVFSTAASLGITGAYDSAITAYTNAIKDSPYDPSIYLAMAQLAASQNKYDDATGYIGSALQLKSNYTDAVYLLSQIQVAQGKTADAITSVKFATQLTPTDPTAFFELGLLQYNAAEYSDATTSLATAVSLNPNYANAQYFLGLSYAKLGDNPDAIIQFQGLAKTNPDNADVASILANLKAGKSPFVNQTPPASTPTKRSSLPISDSAPASGAQPSITPSVNMGSTASTAKSTKK
jgi:tetratricopeptide (TPR) repeat protein